MKGRVGGGGGGINNGGSTTDLLVCFPSRAHLTLMPKPICSPSRLTEPSKRHPSRSGSRGQASPLFKTKSKHMSSEITEPTSPKVTCAGQIKVRAKPRPSGTSDKDWLSGVEEIENLHKHRKKPNWLEALGLKKEFMHFLGALRGLRFDMRCFGSFHGSDVDCTTDEDQEDGEEEEEKEVDSSGSRNIFSKWFMVLEENQDLGYKKEEVEEEVVEEEEEQEEEGDGTFKDVAPTSSVPPPNALLLMRCRSAPAKGWLEGEGGGAGEEVTARLMREEEKEKERLLLMSYAPDFFKVSTEIAKETWVVGSMDPLARCRSWKR